jgi:anti-anti-sigma factor
MADIANIEIVKDGDRVTVIGGGSLDLTNCKKFNDGLKQASQTADGVTVDLRGANFIDSAVVQALGMAGARMLKRDKRLNVIVREDAYPLRVIRISGFESIMDVEVE